MLNGVPRRLIEVQFSPPEAPARHELFAGTNRQSLGSPGRQIGANDVAIVMYVHLCVCARVCVCVCVYLLWKKEEKMQK